MKYLSALPALLLLSLASPAPAARPALLASVAPLAYLLEQVGGEDYEVLQLIPTGSSPHTFEISARRMASLTGCRAFFHLNMPLERRLEKNLLALNPHLLAVNLNQGLDLLPGQEEDHEESRLADREQAGADPHTWLNPLNALSQAKAISLALSRLNPDRAEYYAANLERLTGLLLALDARLSVALAPFCGRGFLVYHPAFAYLAARYGLVQIALEAEGKEPGPRHMAAVLQKARDMGVKIIFIQPSVPAEKVRALARELGARIVAIDPLAEDYILNLQSIAGQLQTGWQ